MQGPWTVSSSTAGVTAPGQASLQPLAHRVLAEVILKNIQVKNNDSQHIKSAVRQGSVLSSSHRLSL